MLGLLTKQTTTRRDYQEGIVTDTIYPGKKWRVSFEATEWSARSDDSATFKPGDFVRVIGRINATTLLIESRP